MTSPLPAQHSKSALEEAKNSQKGGFLDFCASPKSKATASFESLISQNDAQQERKDELEEAEAAKKRRKALDAAAIAAPVSITPDIQASANVEEIPKAPQQQGNKQVNPETQELSNTQLLNIQKFSASPNSSEKTQAQESNANPTPEDLPSFQDLSNPDLPTAQVEREEKTAPQNILTPKNLPQGNTDIVAEQNPQSEDSNAHTDGMESAASDNAMVSLATFEDIQSSVAPKASGELSITSTNRLSVMPSLSERAAIGSTENTGAGGDTPSENFSAGNPALMATNGSFAFQKTAASQASSLLKSLAPEIEKFQQTGHSQVQLELPVSDNESVKIRLSLRAGEIRTTFITESPELREALQKAWPDFTANHRAQGVRFGDSQFQDSFARNQDATSEQGRQREYQQQTASSDTPSKQQQAKNSSHLALQGLPNKKSSSSSINLWA